MRQPQVLHRPRIQLFQLSKLSQLMLIRSKFLFIVAIHIIDFDIISSAFPLRRWMFFMMRQAQVLHLPTVRKLGSTTPPSFRPPLPTPSLATTQTLLTPTPSLVATQTFVQVSLPHLPTPTVRKLGSTTPPSFGLLPTPHLATTQALLTPTPFLAVTQTLVTLTSYRNPSMLKAVPQMTGLYVMQRLQPL